MAGLRERKKARTRQRITEAAWRLFVDRGFEAVTVNEIAEAAEVARATLFAYFPTKESIALEGVGDDDLAAVVTDRPSGQPPLRALRDHFRALAGSPTPSAPPEDLVPRVRVILDSPTLSAAAHGLRYQRREALADALSAEYGPNAAALAAAQVAASVLTLQERYFRRLFDGAPQRDADRALAEDLELAFDLLENGLNSLEER